MSRFDAFTTNELVELEDFRYYSGEATGVRDELGAEIDARTHAKRKPKINLTIGGLTEEQARKIVPMNDVYHQES